METTNSHDGYVVRHEKSIFRPVYLFLTIYTLWHIGDTLITGITRHDPSQGIFAAFNGPTNVDVARLIAGSFVVTSLLYFFTLYVLLEGIEEGLALLTGAKLPSEPHLRFWDYVGRFGIVAVVVLIPKLWYINNYNQAWFIISMLAAAHIVWTVIIRYTRNYIRKYDLFLSIVIFLVCMSVSVISRFGAEQTLGALILLCMFLISVTLCGLTLLLLGSHTKSLMGSVVDFFTVW